MKYNIVVTDYDGTLLKSDDTVSGYTLKVISEFISRGGRFLIATGRMHSGILSQMKKLGLDGINLPLVSYQGAYVRNSIDGKILYDERLSNKQALEVVEYAESRGFYCHTYFDDTLYVSEDGGFARAYADILKVGLNPVGRISDFLKKTNADVHKVLLWLDKGLTYGVVDDLKQKFGNEMLIESPSSQMIDAYSLKAGKDKAVDFVLSDSGKSLNDCIVFGDNYNDYEMVRKAGCGVAVGNAVDKLKNVAKIVADTNNNDGIAKIIEKMCL